MSKTIHFIIALDASKPPIWRKFIVEDSYCMDRFHQTIQSVMAWWNAHLHHFTIQDRTIGILLNDGMDLQEMEDKTGCTSKIFPFRKVTSLNI